MREQFEKLQVIALLLSFRTAIHWNEKRDRYESHDNTDAYNCIYLNGAWYAYQEQQKKIENIASLIDSLVSNSEQFDFESEQVEGVLMDICQCLRSGFIKND